MLSHMQRLRRLKLTLLRLRLTQPVRERLSEVDLVVFQVNSAVREWFDPKIDPTAGSEANMACIVYCVLCIVMCSEIKNKRLKCNKYWWFNG